jgi:hypothetical protein
VTSGSWRRSGIGDNARRDKPIPDKENDQRADRCPDEPGTLVGAVPPNQLAQERRNKCSANAEDGRENES